jgi:hypothetical protein
VLLTIDPGADTGWAQFSDSNTLQRCGLASGADDAEVWSGVWPARVVIERPKIYPHGRQKARPEDIITLAVSAGEWGGIAKLRRCSVEYVEPFEWKGQLNKDVCHARARKRLTAEELVIVDAACAELAVDVQHNVLDAVALGLWVVQR